MDRIIKGIIVACCYIVGGIVVFLAGWILRGVKSKRRTKNNAGSVIDTEEVRTVA